MIRNINVYNALVVVSLGEKFNWVGTPGELPSGASIVVAQSGTDPWPLDQTSYTVTSSAPSVEAQVARDHAHLGTFSFACTPANPNVTDPQTLVVIKNPNCQPCDDVTVAPGGYFVWVNEDREAVFISPDPANTNFWPLPDDQYEVAPQDWLIVHVPDDAAPGDYNLVVTGPDKGGRCDRQTQPKLSVGGGPL